MQQSQKTINCYYLITETKKKKEKKNTKETIILKTGFQDYFLNAFFFLVVEKILKPSCSTLMYDDWCICCYFVYNFTFVVVMIYEIYMRDICSVWPSTIWRAKDTLCSSEKEWFMAGCT